MQCMQQSQLDDVKKNLRALHERSPSQALLGHVPQKELLMSVPEGHFSQASKVHSEALVPSSSRTNWSDVDAKMQKHLAGLAEEIKGQLHSVHQELQQELKASGSGAGSQPHSPSDVREVKANELLPSQMGLDTPRTLARNLEAEQQKAREAQEKFEALRLEAAEAYKRADAAAAEIEIQRRSEEDLQHRLMLERVHERTLKEVVAQTHSREAELKMQVKSQAVKLEQMQFQMRGNSRESTGNVSEMAGRENSRASSTSFFECTGSRDRCGPGPGSERTMVGAPPSFADSSRGYQEPSSRFNSSR